MKNVGGERGHEGELSPGAPCRSSTNGGTPSGARRAADGSSTHPHPRSPLATAPRHSTTFDEDCVNTSEVAPRTLHTYDGDDAPTGPSQLAVTRLCVVNSTDVASRIRPPEGGRRHHLPTESVPAHGGFAPPRIGRLVTRSSASDADAQIRHPRCSAGGVAGPWSARRGQSVTTPGQAWAIQGKARDRGSHPSRRTDCCPSPSS